ncbi:MAG: diguanylate cyclase [Firmicutes bacterium]|nr:diguanylate cyclase [Bacillota bacterium]
MISRLKDTLLLIGNNESERPMLRSIFDDAFNLLEAEGPAQAIFLLQQNESCIAAILSDLPEASEEEFQAISKAALTGTDSEIPILTFLASNEDGKEEEKALVMGASAVIIKPYTAASIRKRLQILLDLYQHKQSLQSMVKEQRKTIRQANQVMLDALSAIIEHRSSESGNHVLRIRRFTKMLLEDIAKNFPEYNLTPSTIDIITGAAALHDIGKISIPDAILNKPGRLTPGEFEVIKTHTTIGGELIQNLSGLGDMEYLRYAYNIALYHHERWDGNGYPEGLSGEDIPICAQAVGLADVFDALTTPRVYKEALPYEEAINMILNGECGTFSPQILACFKTIRADLVALAHQYADGRSPKDDAIKMPLPGPCWKSNPLTTTQLSHVKYLTILHDLNDTIMEIDLDKGLYHVVYNPDPCLSALVPQAAVFDATQLLQNLRIHPEDSAVIEQVNHLLTDEFFDSNVRRKIFRCRIFDAVLNNWQEYELRFLRVNTENESQHVALSVWHRLSMEISEDLQEKKLPLLMDPAMQSLMGSALRCKRDKDLTIQDGLQNLFTLTGYSEEEIFRDFEGNLLSLTLPKDRQSLQHSIQDLLFKGSPQGDLSFRILRKNQEPLWVLAKARVHINNDDQEVLYLVISDNTREKEIEKSLNSAIRKNQIIEEHAGIITFEWDLKADELICSSMWEKHFGYSPISHNYGKQMGIATHFHPDDVPIVQKAIEELRSSHTNTISFDVRIANANAKYLWTRISAQAYLDENNEITRINGILQDIDTLKRADLSLQEQAEQDSLTKLLSKASTQQKIIDYLNDRDENSLCAMLILDLDNFKAINDNYGHLYGDSVLSQVAQRLKKTFRSNDILGRIGGDEFLIFLRDIPHEEMVQNRCSFLLETLQELLEGVAPGLKASCSIGVALIPAHGTIYADLFKHADEALYTSKSKGKNTYTIYDPAQKLSSLSQELRTTTRIESEDEPGMADASFVRFVFQQMYESSNVLDTLNDILAYVGDMLQVSRVYIFENNEENTHCSNTFEWCNQGISQEKDNLQDISYAEDIPGWIDLFNERGVFYCDDISKLDLHFRAILEPQGIKSMLQCAIMDNGVFRGYIGFDECNVQRLWTLKQINLLQFLAEVMSIFLLKKRVQDKNQEQAESFRKILDNQDVWLYIIDPETCELKFLNEKSNRFAKNAIGCRCHEAFRNSPVRCPDCVAENIHEKKNFSTIIENSVFGPRVKAHASEIKWEGKDACLIFCNELEDF